jgi:hypothetical protein
MLSWLEESRFYWSATISRAIVQIIEGKTIVLITDPERQWFANYITDNFNRLSMERPMIPLVQLQQIHPAYDRITSGVMSEMLENMLDLAFGGEYLFWYIGKGDHRRADLAKRSENSLLWVMDEDVRDAFVMYSFENMIDIKLLQLYQLFETTLNSALFGEIDVES